MYPCSACLLLRVYNSQKKNDDGKAAELGMANMYGVFIVLLFGSSLASSFGFLEWFVIILKRSMKYKVINKRHLF